MSIANWKYIGQSFIETDLEKLSLQDGYELGWFGSATASTLKKRWDGDEGVFLFLKVKLPKSDPEKTAAITVLESRLREFLLEPLNARVRFLWIENPNDPVILWRTHSIAVQKGGSNQVSHRGFLNVRNYAFSISQGVEITLKNGVFSFLRKSNNGLDFMLSTEYGEHQFSDIKNVGLPMTGAGAGCLEFGFSVSKEGKSNESFGYSGLEQLDIGMRIFFRDPEFPVAGNDSFLSSHRYPFLQEQYDFDEAFPFFPKSIEWKVSLDVHYPLSQQRSYFEFVSPVASKPDTGLPTAFRTNHGYTVHLLPKTGESHLYFSPRPATLREEDLLNAPFYLVPAGKFEVKVPKYSSNNTVKFISEANIICGISGLEYIKIGSGFEMHLIPGKPAFAGSFLSFYALLRDFNGIQKRFQRSVWVDPENPNNPLMGGAPIDLPETFDLDMEIEATDGLNISDDARMAMLEEVLTIYFPGNFIVTKKQRELYLSIVIVEDWIKWFHDQLKEATLLIGRDNSLLSNEVTTSWAYITGSPNAIYFAQPDNAVLHMAEASSKEFLDYMEVPAMGLPNNVNDLHAFPMMPYGNVNPGSVTDIRQLEMLVLNPVRRKLVHQIGEAENFSTKLTTDITGNRIGTTPQGLMAEFSNDWKAINELRLAKDTKGKIIGFADILHGSPLKSALQSNQLFLVISDPAAIMEYFSNAKLKENLKSDLKSVTENIINNSSLQTKPKNDLKKALNEGIEDISETDLKEVIIKVINDANIDNGLKSELNDAIENEFKNALENDLDILDWVFELGPGFWDLNDTIMVFKYTNTSLLEMAAQPESWFMPETFNKDHKNTSANLQQLLSDAIELGTGSDPKARRKYESLAKAASQPNWTGILMLNVHVPLRGLPDSLKALAGGMNPDLFYAKYIGVEVTQVKTTGSGEQTALDPQQSSIFGLIDYDNPETPVAEPSGYNFHVPSLSVVFQNSHIVHFAAVVDLILEKIFDERARLYNSPNNIVSLKGVAEEHNGRVTYSFGFSGANCFKLSGKVLEEVEIVKAQFSTDPLGPKANRPNVLKVKGRFSLWGRVRFAYLRDFDILSFGRTPNTILPVASTPSASTPPPDYLSISNLEITMSFKLNQESNQVLDRGFDFDPSKITVDMIKSGWRQQSLFEQFPFTFRGFVNVRTPDGGNVKTGYMPVSAPARRANLKENYYAIKFDLKLGNLGALSGSKPLIAGILVAWVPGKEGIFVGLKLPGSSSDKREIIIQGLLKLTFKSIRFVVFDKEQIPANENEEQRKLREKTERRVGYLLNLKNIKLNFFLISFPPIGQTEMTLFGDPRDETKRADRLIGWYASYVKN